jgi:hypothetical protein
VRRFSRLLAEGLQPREVLRRRSILIEQDCRVDPLVPRSSVENRRIITSGTRITAVPHSSGASTHFGARHPKLPEAFAAVTPRAFR